MSLEMGLLGALLEADKPIRLFQVALSEGGADNTNNARSLDQ